jgi:ABC-type transport system involved in multi-copper enzyme maturation permease subunit
VTLLAATAIVRRLQLGETRRGRLLGYAGLLALPALAAIALAGAGHWGGGVFDELLEPTMGFLAPFLCATLFGPAIADEVERGTAGFLFVRPAPRAALLLGRLSVAGPVLIGAACGAMLVSFFALHLRFPDDIPRALPHLFAALFAMALALLLYALLAVGIGASFRKRPVGALLVLFLVDAGLSRTPFVLRVLSPAHHLRAVGGFPDSGVALLPFTIPLWASALYLFALVAGAAWLGLRRLSLLETTGESS